jgi:hypothetical protein
MEADIVEQDRATLDMDGCCVFRVRDAKWLVVQCDQLLHLVDAMLTQNLLPKSERHHGTKGPSGTAECARIMVCGCGGDRTDGISSRDRLEHVRQCRHYHATGDFADEREVVAPMAQKVRRVRGPSAARSCCSKLTL